MLGTSQLAFIQDSDFFVDLELFSSIVYHWQL